MALDLFKRVETRKGLFAVEKITLIYNLLTSILILFLFQEMDHPVQMLADRVVIKTVEVEETTKGGLILTGSAKEKPQVAQVIAVGPGGVVDGKEVKMTVKVGDKVLTSKYSGTEVKVDGEECTIVRQSDILAVVED